MIAQEPTNKSIWEQEWSLDTHDQQLVPGHAVDAPPSESIVHLVEHLKTENVAMADMACVDMGCGTGRNSFYLAKNLRFVYGVDYAETAISSCQDLAARDAVTNVLFEQQDVTADFVHEAGAFDLALDSLTSTSIMGVANRGRFADNIFRLLKIGGLVLARAVSENDELETELMATSPGPEPNSSIWPVGNKFQKNFSLDELTALFGQFDPVVITEERKLTRKMGRDFVATNWWALFRKTKYSAGQR